MKFIFTILIFICSLTSAKDVGCLQLDIVIVADVSTSVVGYEKFITDAVIEFTNKFKNTDVRIGLITFSDACSLQFHLGDSVTFLAMTGGSSNLTCGLIMANKELFGEYGKPSNKKMVIVLSDGDVSNKEKSKLAINMMKENGVNFAGILIKSNDNKSTFMKEISDLYVETDYKSLADELKKLDVCL